MAGKGSKGGGGGSLSDFVSRRMTFMDSPRIDTKTPPTSGRGIIGSSKSGIIGGSLGNSQSPPATTTVCHHCGVSYRTISEMRTLQVKLKEQETKLRNFQELELENTRLKETLANIRKTHIEELLKKDEQTRKFLGHGHHGPSGDSQILEALQKQLKETHARNADFVQKYAIVSEDCRHQTEVIAQLRARLSAEKTEDSRTQGEILLMRKREMAMEGAMRATVTELQGHLARQSPTESAQVLSRLTQQHPLIQSFIKRSEVSSGSRAQGAECSPTSPCQLTPTKGKPLLAPSPSTSSGGIHHHHPDLQRQNSALSDKVRLLKEEQWSLQEMHSFLRNTLDKLKGENKALHDEMNKLKVSNQEGQVLSQNLQVQLQGALDEVERGRQGKQDLEAQIVSLTEQLRELQRTHDPKIVDQLQKKVISLQRQIGSHRSQVEEVTANFNKKLAEAQRETRMEKERGDSVLAASLAERDEVEKRWADRWARHQTSLNEQLDGLKVEYERALTTAREHQEGLQNELEGWKVKFEESRSKWDSHKVSLNEQVDEWRTKYESIHEELKSTRMAKVQIEVMYQDKNQELEDIHEMVREGCEERQELQDKIESLMESLEEERSQGQRLRAQSQGYYSPSRSPSHLLETHSFSSQSCTSMDSSDLREDPKVGPGSPFQGQTPPAPNHSPAVKVSMSESRRLSDPILDPQIFTVGRGKRMTSTKLNRAISTAPVLVSGGGGDKRSGSVAVALPPVTPGGASLSPSKKRVSSNSRTGLSCGTSGNIQK